MKAISGHKHVISEKLFSNITCAIVKFGQTSFITYLPEFLSRSLNQ